VDARQFEFEWDEAKASANVRKHGISFEVAGTVFQDPRLVTVADLDHSDAEERWFSLGYANNGSMIAVVYLWSEVNSSTIRIRLISARRAKPSEIRYYQEST
jgi:hypothetical protein